MTRNELAIRLVEDAQKGLINPVWNKIYRTDLLRQHGIRFEIGLESAEDLLFNLDYLRATDGGGFLVDTTGLYYVKNAESVTHALAGRYDEIHDLDRSVAYREMLRSRFAEIGVPEAAASGYFRSKDNSWFYTMVKNIQNPGTPYNLRQQVRQVRRVMDFAPARTNILSDASRARLSVLNRALFRVNSATLAWLIYRAV